MSKLLETISFFNNIIMIFIILNNYLDCNIVYDVVVTCIVL